MWSKLMENFPATLLLAQLRANQTYLCALLPRHTSTQHSLREDSASFEQQNEITKKTKQR
jgi:hypothetical protein